MTRKFTRKTHTLRVIAQLFGVLTVLIALALAQTGGQGKSSMKMRVPFAPQGSSNVDARAIQRESWIGGSQPPLDFLPPVIYGSGGPFASSVAVADVNGDDKPDLVVADDSSVGVLLGNGDGTFQTAVTYSSGGAFLDSVAVADVNGDGSPDLVVANEAGLGTIGVLLGNADGT